MDIQASLVLSRGATAVRVMSRAKGRTYDPRPPVTLRPTRLETVPGDSRVAGLTEPGRRLFLSLVKVPYYLTRISEEAGKKDSFLRILSGPRSKLISVPQMTEP